MKYAQNLKIIAELNSMAGDGPYQLIVIIPKSTQESHIVFLKTTYFPSFFIHIFIIAQAYSLSIQLAKILQHYKSLTKQIAMLLARAFWNLYSVLK